jgi:hypothetical protein
MALFGAPHFALTANEENYFIGDPIVLCFFFKKLKALLSCDENL